MSPRCGIHILGKGWPLNWPRSWGPSLFGRRSSPFLESGTVWDHAVDKQLGQEYSGMENGLLRDMNFPYSIYITSNSSGNPALFSPYAFITLKNHAWN